MIQNWRGPGSNGKKEMISHSSGLQNLTLGIGCSLVGGGLSSLHSRQLAYSRVSLPVKEFLES